MKAGVLILVPALAAACASPPATPGAAEGEEEIEVIAYTRSEDSTVQWISGTECTLRNDKGVWKMTTPATVKVFRSTQNMELDCVEEGFEPSHISVPCAVPSVAAPEMTTLDKVGIGLGVLEGVLAIAAAPLLPPLAAQAGLNAIVGLSGPARKYASKPDIPNLCFYGSQFPLLTPKKDGLGTRFRADE